MFWIPLAIAAGSALASANAAKNAGKSGAGNTLDEAVAGLKGVDAPTAEDLTYRLDQLVQQGLLTPEQAKAYLVDKSSFDSVSTDPRLRAAQMGALSSLQDIGSEGGLTATDKAKIAEITSRNATAERGSREAIVQHAAEMGRSGTPMELAALLENQQGSATRAAQEGTDVAALAEQRALDALSQAGTLGGQVRGQDFGEAAQKAEAQDALKKFNAEHLNSTENTNVAARNTAAAANLAEKQRVSDTNTQITGQNRKVAADAQQTVFENEMTRRKAIADALAAKAQQQTDARKSKDAMVGGLLGTAGTVGAGLLSKSDERSKNIEDKAPDMDAFLASLKPLAFKYKDPGSAGAAPGENVGVVAQDVEKTPTGRTMVKDTPDGKMLDMQKGFGVILAALASLHDKYDQLEQKAA